MKFSLMKKERHYVSKLTFENFWWFVHGIYFFAFFWMLEAWIFLHNEFRSSCVQAYENNIWTPTFFRGLNFLCSFCSWFVLSIALAYVIQRFVYKNLMIRIGIGHDPSVAFWKCLFCCNLEFYVKIVHFVVTIKSLANLKSYIWRHHFIRLVRTQTRHFTPKMST